MASRKALSMGPRTSAGRFLVVGLLVAAMAPLAVSPAGGTTPRPQMRPARPAALGSVLMTRVRGTGRLPTSPVSRSRSELRNFLGALSKKDLSSPAVGMAVSPGGRGYWILTSSGRVFNFGQAEPHGSISSGADDHAVAIVAQRAMGADTGSRAAPETSSTSVMPSSTARPAAAISRARSSPWPLTRVAGVTGSPIPMVRSSTTATPVSTVRRPVSTFATTSWRSLPRPTAGATGWSPRGGGVFSYGDAHFYGSATGEHLRDHIVACCRGASRQRLLAGRLGRRGVFTYGDASLLRFGLGAPSAGSVPTSRSSRSAAGPDGRGYWLLPSIPSPLGLPAPGSRLHRRATSRRSATR